MAARKRVLNHSPEVRQRIQTSQLLRRLQENAMGRLDPELSTGQIRSIEILLKKTLPDVTTVRIGDSEGMTMEAAPVLVKFVE